MVVESNIRHVMPKLPHSLRADLALYMLRGLIADLSTVLQVTTMLVQNAW